MSQTLNFRKRIPIVQLLVSAGFVWALAACTDQKPDLSLETARLDAMVLGRVDVEVMKTQLETALKDFSDTHREAAQTLEWYGWLSPDAFKDQNKEKGGKGSGNSASNPIQVSITEPLTRNQSQDLYQNAHCRSLKGSLMLSNLEQYKKELAVILPKVTEVEKKSPYEAQQMLSDWNTYMEKKGRDRLRGDVVEVYCPRSSEPVKVKGSLREQMFAFVHPVKSGTYYDQTIGYQETFEATLKQLKADRKKITQKLEATEKVIALWDEKMKQALPLFLKNKAKPVTDDVMKYASTVFKEKESVAIEQTIGSHQEVNFALIFPKARGAQSEATQRDRSADLPSPLEMNQKQKAEALLVQEKLIEKMRAALQSSSARHTALALAEVEQSLQQEKLAALSMAEHIVSGKTKKESYEKWEWALLYQWATGHATSAPDVKQSITDFMQTGHYLSAVDQPALKIKTANFWVETGWLFDKGYAGGPEKAKNSIEQDTGAYTWAVAVGQDKRALREAREISERATDMIQVAEILTQKNQVDIKSAESQKKKTHYENIGQAQRAITQMNLDFVSVFKRVKLASSEEPAGNTIKQ